MSAAMFWNSRKLEWNANSFPNMGRLSLTAGRDNFRRWMVDARFIFCVVSCAKAVEMFSQNESFELALEKESS
jgi:hypothetical protein